MAPFTLKTVPDNTAIALSIRAQGDASVGLAPDEDTRNRVARLLNPQARADILHARALMRRLAAQTLGIPPGSVVLSRSASGAPYLAEHPDLGISWSHSGGLALAACRFGGRIGVDVEALSRAPKAWPAMLALVATPAEAVELRSMDPGEAATGFLRLWTLKEAVLKALGTGFRRDPRQIALPLARLHSDGDGMCAGLHIHCAHIADLDAVIALASDSPASTISPHG